MYRKWNETENAAKDSWTFWYKHDNESVCPCDGGWEKERNAGNWKYARGVGIGVKFYLSI